jgi:hypothetical protein
MFPQSPTIDPGAERTFERREDVVRYETHLPAAFVSDPPVPKREREFLERKFVVQLRKTF